MATASGEPSRVAKLRARADGLARGVARRIRFGRSRAQLDASVAALERSVERLTRVVENGREYSQVLAREGVAHTDAATQAAVEAAVRASREHAEAASQASADAAIAVSRTHAEEATRASAEAMLLAAHQHAEAASGAALAEAMTHAELLGTQTTELVRAELAAIRRELRSIQRASPSSTEALATSAPAVPADRPVVDPSFYVALEDRFRGAVEEIQRRQSAYLDLVVGQVDDEYPLADLGCGRGEWLRVLAEAGVSSFGVDTNRAFVAESAEDGLDVRESDLVTFLRDQPDGSLGAVSMFQVVEHLPFGVLLAVLADAARVLRPGGVLIAETPNALNLQVAATNFWLDPTHERPLHPALLEFAATWCGFTKVEGRYLNPLGRPATGAAGGDHRVDRLVELIDGPGDYALVAWT